MRLTRLSAYHVRIPLKHKVRHASHVREETDSLIVRCELDNGMVGWGEGLPRPYVTGESIDNVKKVLPTLKDGAFAENIITRGLDLTALKIGDRLRVGEEVILEITQIGKECHNQGCAIKKATGDCIMPREGLFARVIQGGEAKPGDTIRCP